MTQDCGHTGGCGQADGGLAYEEVERCGCWIGWLVGCDQSEGGEGKEEVGRAWLEDSPFSLVSLEM